MNANDFNDDQLARGLIDAVHITQLTLIAQPVLGVDVDGKCGDETRAALEERIGGAMTVAGGAVLGRSAVAVARSMLGRGEEGANNSGPLIAQLGDGRWPDGTLWCALFAGYCWRRADPAASWFWRREGVPEPGAKALVDAAAKVGSRFTDPHAARPGDLVLWERDGGHHVGLVERGDGDVIHTLEGNTGRFPAKVRRLSHDVAHEPHFVCFARPWR